ncbi:hypothetical protein MMIC_P1724 [Mariprofundus micogutta]|uniref:Uncharacterized protein n=1 Tax=Mariprofundus micogutta TaxID=1921010 RepID=A0A1L8CP99_9PROT|nr:tyrosine-type recombinase/integrase [Mariprofundus micogutta]GAV20751.1 hypothetical protein MMIC_P1724 [Mariprofundus micogutta]
MKKKITQKFIDSLTNSTGKDMFVRDTELPGFVVKVSKAGHKTFCVEARIKQGPTRRITISPCARISLRKARDTAKELLAQMSNGIDPRKEAQAIQKAKKLEAVKDITLEAALNDYFELRRTKPKTEVDYRSAINNHLADWLKRPLREITTEELLKRHRHIGESKGKEATANLTMRALRAIFNKMIQVYKIMDDNPVNAVQSEMYLIRPRERFVSLDLLTDFIDELLKLKNQVARDYLLMTLLTGLRRNEMAPLTWSQIDFKNKIFTIPGDQTKNHKDHHVPLAPLTYLILCHRKKFNSKDGPYVFPASRGRGHISEPKSSLAKIEAETGVHITTHDLRRTFATYQDEMGVSSETISKLLNHKLKSVAERHYILRRKDRYRAELKGICDYIESLTSFEKHEQGETISINWLKEFYVTELTDTDYDSTWLVERTNEDYTEIE